jgi:hypothetical protein
METTKAKLLKRQKKLITTICFMAVVTPVSIVYAFVQQGIVREQAMIAKELEEKVRLVADEAIRQEKIAMRQAELKTQFAIEAQRQQAIAEAALSMAHK